MADPAASWRATSSSSGSNECEAASIPAPTSPSRAYRSGTVSSVKSSSSASGTSSQVSGALTVADGRGRTEYTDATVRSFAFWL
jgi:hypothetical protein